MPEPVKQMKRAPESAFWYRLRLWAGWTVYAIGWAVWFISLWMPAAFLVPHATLPLPTIDFLVLDMVGCLGALARLHFYSGLLIVPYFLGLAAAVGCALCSNSARILTLLRITSLCGFLVDYVGVGYSMEHHRRFLEGFPLLALGSTLICLGVWLIPPQQGHKDIVAFSPAPGSQVGPASGTRIGGE